MKHFFPSNHCKLQPIKKDMSHLLIVFGNNPNARYKMAIVKKQDDGKIILRRAFPGGFQQCLYVVDPGEGWRPYHVIQQET